MGSKAQKYHTNLSSYFKGQILFFDGDEQKQPNVRKCMEQPWQLTKAELWDEVTETLISVDFLNTKCKGGLSFDLILDYNRIMNLIPQNKKLKEREDTRKSILNRYILDLIKYSEGSISKLNIINSVNLKQYNSNDDDDKSFKLLKKLQKFFQTEVYNLSLYSNINGFVNQHIRNSIPKQLIEKYTNKCIIQKRVFKDIDNPNINLASKTLQNELAVNQIVRSYLDDNIISLSQNLITTWDIISLNSISYIKDNISYDHNRIIKSWYCIDISADGKILIAGRGKIKIFSMSYAPLNDDKENLIDYSLEIWDLEGNKCIDILTGHLDNVNCASITPDAKYAITGSSDKTIRLWDIKNRKCLKILEGHKKSVTAVSISPDGKYAVSGGDDSLIIYWDLDSNTHNSFNGHSGRITSVRLTPDHRFAISSDQDLDKILNNIGEISTEEPSNIIVWNLSKLTIHTKLSGDKYWINCVDITPDAKLAASVGYEGRIKIWEIHSTNCILTIDTGNSNINNIILHPDGSQLVSCSGRKFITHSDENKTSQVNEITIWELEHKTQEVLIPITNSNHNELDSSKSHKEFIVINDKVHQVDLINRSIELVSSLPVNIAFETSPDNTSLLCYKYNYVGLWSIKDHKFNSEYSSLGRVQKAIILPDNRTVLYSEIGNTDFHISSFETGLIKRINLETGEIRPIISGYRNGDIVFNYFQEGKKIIYCDSSFSTSSFKCNNSLRVFDFIKNVSEELIASDKIKHSSSITEIAISPNEEWIATCAGESGAGENGDNYIVIWNLKTYKGLYKLNGHNDIVNHIKFSPDGERLISCSDDKTIIIWNIQELKIENILYGHSKAVMDFELTSDCMNIISFGHDKTIRIWDLLTQECIGIHPLSTPLKAYKFIENKDSLIINEYGSSYILKLNFHTTGIKYSTPIKIERNDQNSAELEESTNIDSKELNNDNYSYNLNSPISLFNKANNYFNAENYSNASEYYEKFLIAIGRNLINRYPVFMPDYKRENDILKELKCPAGIADIEYKIAACLIKSRRGCYGAFGVTVSDIKTRLTFNGETDKVINLDNLISYYNNRR